MPLIFHLCCICAFYLSSLKKGLLCWLGGQPCSRGLQAGMTSALHLIIPLR